MDISKYRFVAHRGVHDEKFVENSLEAFELAVKNNIAVELDVHLTKDEKIVVVHDSNLKRVTGKNMIVEESTLEEIKKITLFCTSSKIPTLEEVLEVISGRVPLIIEIKNERKVGNLEENLYNILKNYQGDYVIESFNPLSLYYFKRIDKNIIRGQLSAKKIDDVSSFLNFLLSHMFFNIFTKPNFIAYRIDDINEKMYKKYNKKGIYLIAWTLKNKEEYKKYNKICDGFILDNYDSLKDDISFGELYEKK